MIRLIHRCLVPGFFYIAGHEFDLASLKFLPDWLSMLIQPIISSTPPFPAPQDYNPLPSPGRR